MKRLGKNSSPKNAWKEAMNLLGRQRTAKPECTSNSDPSDTAEYQSQYFVTSSLLIVNKINKLAKGQTFKSHFLTNF